MVTWIVLGAIVLLVFWAIGIYNGLVTSRNGYGNAFAQIDVQLQRRHDLIPNLVETAKGYLKHERDTLEAVIQARNSAQSGLNAAKANPGTQRWGVSTPGSLDRQVMEKLKALTGVDVIIVTHEGGGDLLAHERFLHSDLPLGLP